MAKPKSPSAYYGNECGRPAHFDGTHRHTPENQQAQACIHDSIRKNSLGNERLKLHSTSSCDMALPRRTKNGIEPARIKRPKKAAAATSVNSTHRLAKAIGARKNKAMRLQHPWSRSPNAGVLLCEIATKSKVSRGLANMGSS